jgi:hypothetical protein
MKAKTSSSKVLLRFSLRLAPSLFVASLIAFCPLATRANTIALSFTGTGLVGAGLDQTFGWAFTLHSPVLLTDLGVFDFPDRFPPGLAESHLVTVWTSTGIQVAQGTVPSGTSGTLVDNFRYSSIAPVRLAAGNYTIGAFYISGSRDPVPFLATTVTTAAGVTYDGSRFGNGNAFPPGDQANFPHSYFGPNFQFTAGVPDSAATWTLMLLGLTATFSVRFLVPRLAQFASNG